MDRPPDVVLGAVSDGGLASTFEGIIEGGELNTLLCREVDWACGEASDSLEIVSIQLVI